MSQRPIRRALLSVSDKTGLLDLVRGLADLQIELISTGGTRKTLADAGLAVRDVADVTGFPEMLDGRVKTLHPNIHGGILAVRDNPEHVAVLEKHGIGFIDLVVCNLYPFEATVARPGATHEEIVENIDIGGPTLVRAAAKNYHDVAVVTDPGQYAAVLEEMKNNQGRSRRRRASGWQPPPSYASPLTTRPSPPTSRVRRAATAGRRRSTRTGPSAPTSVTARTRTRRPPSTSIPPAAAPASPRRRCCTGRNCRSTTFLIWIAP